MAGPACTPAELRTGGHPMGGRLRLRHGLHRHVADGQKESRKLDLVDVDKHCIHPAVLYQRLCIYSHLLCRAPFYRLVRMGGMEEKGGI